MNCTYVLSNVVLFVHSLTSSHFKVCTKLFLLTVSLRQFLDLPQSDIDVMFAMGADGSGASTLFNQEKAIIAAIVDRHGSSKAKYGLIQYGYNSAETLRRLSQFTNNLDFKRFVGSRTLTSRGRALIPAMDKASEEFLSSNAKQKVFVLFANALPFVSFNELVSASRSLRSNGVKVVVVYSGSSADRTRLQQIVANNKNLFSWNIGTRSSVIGSKIALQLFKGLLFLFTIFN